MILGFMPNPQFLNIQNKSNNRVRPGLQYFRFALDSEKLRESTPYFSWYTTKPPKSSSTPSSIFTVVFIVFHSVGILLFTVTFSPNIKSLLPCYCGHAFGLNAHTHPSTSSTPSVTVFRNKACQSHSGHESPRR